MAAWARALVGFGIVVSVGACHRDAPPSAHGPSPGATVAASAAQPAHRMVRPDATDPSIGAPEDPHEVFVPEGKKNGKLFVFLPGTHGKPSNVENILALAAEHGYLTIGLSYPDDVAAAGCRSDLACYGAFRQRAFDGTGGSRLVDVSPANAIENRLVKLLEHLDASAPGEGWGAFLAGGKPVYGSIAFAGHSQGGGHAAFIAMQHPVARVIMFSSICDAADGEPPIAASWVSAKHATPIDRYYGFDNTGDKFAAHVAATWTALGLDGLRKASVDRTSPPYGGAHELTTSIRGPTPMWAHKSVLHEHDGVNFRDVWAYLIGP
ncbi:MAG TPA: hypothetical protein VIY73_06155 [Polyangiaceae bacterium]